MCVCIYGRPLGVGEKRKDLEIKEVDSSPNSLRFLAAGAQASLSTVQSLSFPPPACQGRWAMALHLDQFRGPPRAFWTFWGQHTGDRSNLHVSVSCFFVLQMLRTL